MLLGELSGPVLYGNSSDLSGTWEPRITGKAWARRLCSGRELAKKKTLSGNKKSLQMPSKERIIFISKVHFFPVFLIIDFKMPMINIFVL